VTINKGEWADQDHVTTKKALMSSYSGDKPEIKGAFEDFYSNIGYLTDEELEEGVAYYFEYRIYTETALGNGDIINIYDTDGTTLLRTDTDVKETDAPWQTRPLKPVTNKMESWTVPLYNIVVEKTKYNIVLPDATYWLDLRVADRGGTSVTVRNIAFTSDADRHTGKRHKRRRFYIEWNR